MKKIVNLSGIIIIVISFFSSCTIEKRRYVSGYHIQWKNTNYSAAKRNVQVNRSQSGTTKISSNQSISSPCIIEEIKTASPPNFTVNKSSGNVRENINTSLKINNNYKINTKATEIDVTSKNKSKENNRSGIFGLLSFVMLIGIVIVAGSIVGDLAVVIISVLALAAIAFAIIGVGKERKLKGFAIATLVIASLALIVLVLLLLFPVGG